MAGRPVYRPAELKILTTTSLYGNGSSQYNRLRLKAKDYPELEYDVAWQELAKTAGYGTVHFSPATSRTLREVSERIWRSRRINHRFGEGVSPRLRQIRKAVLGLGIDPDAVLNHATPRIFYGCELHPGARAELMGLYPATESKGAPAGVIASLWRQRWLANRIRNPDVLAQIAGANAQSLVNFFAEAVQGKALEDEAAADLVNGGTGS